MLFFCLYFGIYFSGWKYLMWLMFRAQGSNLTSPLPKITDTGSIIDFSRVGEWACLVGWTGEIRRGKEKTHKSSTMRRRGKGSKKCWQGIKYQKREEICHVDSNFSKKQWLGWGLKWSVCVGKQNLERKAWAALPHNLWFWCAGNWGQYRVTLIGCLPVVRHSMLMALTVSLQLQAENPH